MVEFVLVCLVLLPLMTAILQVGIYLHVRNTARACAHEGARFGANYNRDAGQGAARATECINQALRSSSIGAHGETNGDTVVVGLEYKQPAFGIWGQAWPAKAYGHAAKEPQVTG